MFTDDVLIGAEIIPREVASAAVSGAYADLSRFAISASSISDGECLTLKDGQIRVSARNSGKQILSYNVWLKAWLNYEELLVHHHPDGLSRHRELAAHRRRIHDAQDLHAWKAVYAYDTAIRLELSKSRSLAFSSPFPHLYVANLHAGTLKADAPKCFRCQSTGHVVKNCPFPENGPSSEGKENKKKPEVCFNFNEQKCKFPYCNRQHVCKFCRGPKPSVICGCAPRSQ